jgi:adhesin/invasin
VSATARPLEPANVIPGGAPHGAPAGRALAKPVAFTVTDAYGNAIPDVQVVFAATAGSVVPARVMTDARGQAAARWTLGSQPGEQILRATVQGTAVKHSVVVRALRRTAGE